MKYWLIGLVCLGLTACFGEDMQSAPQYWQGIEFTVEIRPTPPKAGVNEVLVVATRPHRIGEYNLLVSIRMNENDSWIQSIQDSHTGIFRRGLAMQAGPQILWVRVERENKQTVLKFPLNVVE